MRWRELIRMAAGNLTSRWGRTALNLLGVIIGCTTLLLTAACGAGVRDTFYLMFDSSPEARRVIVSRQYSSRQYVDWKKAPEEAIKVPDGVSPTRADRIREQLAHEWAIAENEKLPQRTREPLSLDDVEAFAKLKHIDFAIPITAIPCELDGKDKTYYPSIGYCGNLTGSGEFMIAGSPISEDDPEGVIIHEYLAYKLGHQTDEQLQQLVGKQLEFRYETNSDALRQTPMMSQLGWLFPDRDDRITFMKGFRRILTNLEHFGLTEKQRELIQRLMPQNTEHGAAPEPTQETKPFIVRGVFHTKAEAKSWDMFDAYMKSNTDVRASARVVRQLAREQFAEPKFHNISVMVDSTRNLDAVVSVLKKQDLNVISARRILERVDSEIDRITTIVYWIAGGIVFLTVLGISNTLFISVLQRTPEFGIMKSLGASDGDVLFLMLLEGMICGLIGAIIAVFVSFGIAALGKSLLEDYVVNSMHREIDFNVVISFTPTIIAATLVGSIIVCGIASILPAWRAARLDPVEAMRRD